MCANEEKKKNMHFIWAIYENKLCVPVVIFRKKCIHTSMSSYNINIIFAAK
jgi:hypothetical protein